MSARTVLKAGSSRVLTPDGVRLVTQIGPEGATLQDPAGQVEVAGWAQLPQMRSMTGDEIAAVHEALLPRWDALDQTVRVQALARLEVVLTVTTGFRRGFAALAQESEPLAIFDPSRSSLTPRCEAMARQLAAGDGGDHDLVRRLRGRARPKKYGTTTILTWVRDYRDQGVWGLVDKRAVRDSKNRFDRLPVPFRALVDAEVDRFTGDISDVAGEEVIRRVKIAAKEQGVDLDYPQRLGRQYVSWRKRSKGAGTRTHRTRYLRKSGGYRHYVAIRPGQVVAIDVTRADVLVWDEERQRAMSVEVMTAIDVATRVILALRVVPMSATGLDAALLMYDVMRPFAMRVDGTAVSDWRWCGIPEVIDLICDHTRAQLGSELEDDDMAAAPLTLQGIHTIPGVLPEMVRCDHGSIFVGGFFTTLLTEMGIDLALSRGRRPTDNAHVERVHETYQTFWQRQPGFKGRNTFERGRATGKDRVDADGRALLTARELERALRAWVALEYHRSPHDGLILPDAPRARFTPLEMWDAMIQTTGRIDVPQSPHLLYQFLPVRWATIRHDGVELTGLTYDDPVLDEYRHAAPGTFGRADAKSSFFYDPRDITRIWWRHPATGQVHEVPWRGAWKLDAPLTDKVLALVRSRIPLRSTSTARAREDAREQVIRELTELHMTGTPVADQAFWSAAALRVDTSRRDHLEALLAAYARERTTGAPPGPHPGTEWLRDTPRVTPEPPMTPETDPGADEQDAEGHVIDFTALWARLRPAHAPDAGETPVDEKAW